MREKIETMISRAEDRALSLGDLLTAIKLNWLRNAVRFDDMDTDQATFQFFSITLDGKYAQTF